MIDSQEHCYDGGEAGSANHATAPTSATSCSMGIANGKREVSRCDQRLDGERHSAKRRSAESIRDTLECSSIHWAWMELI